MGSMDGGNSTLFIGQLRNKWTDTGFGDVDVSVGYTHEQTSDIASETSSTAGSNYGNVARTNFNDPEVGTSDYERVHRATVNLGITEHFFSDLATRFNLFGQAMSGQHYSLVFRAAPSSTQSPLGPTGTSGNSLLYIPKVDPTTGLVTATSDPIVAYGPGFGSLADFNAMLKAQHLLKYAGQIIPRNSQSGPWSDLVNIGLEQELPVTGGSDRLIAVMDIYNFLNLLNPSWGAYTSPNFYQAYEAVDASIVGGKYQFNAFKTQQQLNANFTTQRTSSTFQVQLGIRYEF
jgi:hypothetical protein